MKLDFIYAKSPSREDVQEAIDRAKDGDTVLVPPGEATWAVPFRIDKSIYIEGAGADKTYIRLRYPENDINPAVKRHETKTIWFRNFTFDRLKDVDGAAISPTK
jgi:hypothetical protein